MSEQPIQMTWANGALTPTSAFWANRAAEQWGDGEILMVEARMERSDASHRHYFAAVKEAWDNLPDDKREQYPSPEHLRSWALIRAGYRNERNIVCTSPAEARRMCAFMQPMDPYAVVTAKDGVVRVYTAQSQSYRSMDKKTFAESKEKVLDVLAALIGVEAKQLTGDQAA